MRLISLSVWKKTDSDDTTIRLAMVNRIDLLGSMVNFWYQSTILESINFACRTIVTRTPLGGRATVGMSDIPFDVHCHVQSNGLACCIVAENDYPQRVAFNIVFETLTKFYAKIGDRFNNVTKDQTIEPPFMKEDLNLYQDPKNDKLCKIQSDIDEIKDVMRQNIEEVLKRGETFDSLLDKSKDLSEDAKKFHKDSEEMNSCWKRWGCEIM